MSARTARSVSGERGSGTLLMLGLVAVVLTLIAVIALLAETQSARGAAQAAADLGALAAAEHLVESARGGAAPVAGARGTACAVARAVVSANGASLTGCALLDDGVVRVTTAQSGGLGPARASARAGPAPPGTG